MQRTRRRRYGEFRTVSRVGLLVVQRDEEGSHTRRRIWHGGGEGNVRSSQFHSAINGYRQRPVPERELTKLIFGYSDGKSMLISLKCDEQHGPLLIGLFAVWTDIWWYQSIFES